MKYTSLFLATLTLPALALEVQITPNIESVKVMHNGKEVMIKRNQEPNNTIKPEFTKTSRPCPPFCIQPMILAPGIATISELELLDYLKKISNGDNSILVIDSRTPDWVIKGSIPGAISIPWDLISGAKSSPPIVKKLLEEILGVKISEQGKDFKEAKTLILFCNGPWCNQSASNIRALLKLGYPAEKLKWYRGGLQAWESFGLTTVTDIPMPWLGF
jgi:rhodanese-related sulfurtransferase